MTDTEKKYKEVENELASLKQKLIAEMREKLAECTTSARHDSSELLDLAADGELDDMTARIAEADSLKIGQIEQALDMLRDGNYGVCQRCGEQISSRRLKAIPFATLCIECKEQEEQGHYAGRSTGRSRQAPVNIDLADRSQTETNVEDVFKEVESSGTY